MSEVKLVVGGRNYSLACEDGQEEHVRKLAGMIDERMNALGNNLSKIESKDLLFAALFLADELDEARNGNSSSAAAPQTAKPDTDAIAAVLEALAMRLEKTADMLESETPASYIG